MSAERAIHAAFVAALAGDAAFAGLVNGVFDGEPVKGSIPYAVVDMSGAVDWSSKTAAGREVRMAVTIHEAGETPARLRTAMEAVQPAIDAVAREPDGWRVASLVFLRSRVARAARGGWTGLIEYRVRMMEMSQ